MRFTTSISYFLKFCAIIIIVNFCLCIWHVNGLRSINISNEKCPIAGKPICATNGFEVVMLPNECVLAQRNREASTNVYRKISSDFCAKDCHLVCSTVYAPICALNGRTNIQRTFNNRCEMKRDSCLTKNVWYQLYADECFPINETPKNSSTKSTTIKRKPSIVCSQFFNPVCGTYAGVKSTFINECQLHAENQKSGKDWRIFAHGICAEDASQPSLNTDVSANDNENAKFKRSDVDIAGVHENANIIYAPPIVHTEYLRENESGYDNRHSPTYPNFIIPEGYTAYNLDAAAIKNVAIVGKSKSIQNDKHKKIQIPLYQTTKKIELSQQYNNIESTVSPKPTQIAIEQLHEYLKEPLARIYTVKNSANDNDLMEIYKILELEDMKVKNTPTEESTITAQLPLTTTNAPAINVITPKPVKKQFYYIINKNITASTPQMLQQIPQTSNNSFYEQNFNGSEISESRVRLVAVAPPANLLTMKNYENKFQIVENNENLSTISDIHGQTDITNNTKNERNKKEINNEKQNADVEPAIIRRTDYDPRQCQFGNLPICGSYLGNTRTFVTICEMFSRNIFFKENWFLLHEGECDVCQQKIECSKEYAPICIEKNGIYYTLANECWLHKNLCHEKLSDLRVIKSGECKEPTNFTINNKTSAKNNSLSKTSDENQISKPPTTNHETKEINISNSNLNTISFK